MSSNGTEVKHTMPGQHVYEGMVMPGIFPAQALDAIKDFEFQDDDILVATYPKAGTTWMQEILDLVMKEADISEGGEKLLTDRVPFMEIVIPGIADGLQTLKDMPAPRLMKTHLQRHFFERLTTTKKTKVIVVMRNQKDNIVSYYHFYRSNVVLGRFKGTFEDFLQMVDEKQITHGDCLDFNLSWWAEKDNLNVMFTTYEDMIADTGKEVRRVAAFVGKTLNDEQINTICSHVTFDAMSSNKHIQESFNKVMDNKISPFMRKGKVGDWRNYFSKEDSERFDKLYSEKVVGTGLEVLLGNGN